METLSLPSALISQQRKGGTVCVFVCVRVCKVGKGGCNGKKRPGKR